MKQEEFVATKSAFSREVDDRDLGVFEWVMLYSHDVHPDMFERCLYELADGMSLIGRNHKIFRFILL